MQKKTDDKKQKCKNCEGKGTLKKGKSCSLSKVRRHRHQAVTRTHNENAPWHEATGRNSFDD
jgi:hypothetical protein